MLSINKLAEIENEARDFRERMGIPDDDKIDMVDVLRRMKFAGEIADVFYESLASFAESDARFDPITNSIIVSEVSAKRQNARDRFTYAHEIGHKVGGAQFSAPQKNRQAIRQSSGKRRRIRKCLCGCVSRPRAHSKRH